MALTLVLLGASLSALLLQVCGHYSKKTLQYGVVQNSDSSILLCQNWVFPCFIYKNWAYCVNWAGPKLVLNQINRIQID